jgi:hypothetical protein
VANHINPYLSLRIAFTLFEDSPSLVVIEVKFISSCAVAVESQVKKHIQKSNTDLFFDIWARQAIALNVTKYCSN